MAQAKHLQNVSSVLMLALVLAMPAIALAEASVAVIVRSQGQPSDATVTITNEAGHTCSCETHEGTCEIAGLTPGRHTVYAENEHGRAESRAIVVADGKNTVYLVAP